VVILVIGLDVAGLGDDELAAGVADDGVTLATCRRWCLCLWWCRTGGGAGGVVDVTVGVGDGAGEDGLDEK
jgi:hypothetical protein